MNINDLVRPKRVRNLQNLDVSNSLKLGHPFDLSGFKDLDKGLVANFPVQKSENFKIMPNIIIYFENFDPMKSILPRQISVTYLHCRRV